MPNDAQKGTVIVMLEWVSIGATAIRTASGVVKDLRGLKTDAAVAEKAIELNGLILDIQEQFMAAQADRAALADEVRQLRAQLDAKEDWRNERMRYREHSFDTGAMAYVHIGEGTEPKHFICPNCFEEGQKRVLQPCALPQGDGLKCPRCKSEVFTKPYRFEVMSI